MTEYFEEKKKKLKFFCNTKSDVKHFKINHCNDHKYRHAHLYMHTPNIQNHGRINQKKKMAKIFNNFLPKEFQILYEDNNNNNNKILPIQK